MVQSIVVNTAGVDQSPARATASAVAYHVSYYVARTLVLATGERLADVPVSRRVSSIGIANRLLKRARRRVGDVYLVCASRRQRHQRHATAAVA